MIFLCLPKNKKKQQHQSSSNVHQVNSLFSWPKLTVKYRESLSEKWTMKIRSWRILDKMCSSSTHPCTLCPWRLIFSFFRSRTAIMKVAMKHWRWRKLLWPNKYSHTYPHLSILCFFFLYILKSVLSKYGDIMWISRNINSLQQPLNRYLKMILSNIINMILYTYMHYKSHHNFSIYGIWLLPL